MSGYIGSKASVVTPGAERKKVFSITTTTTSLTGLVYTPGFVHVYHNGVRLVDGTDYTATSGTSITLTTAAQSGDEVVVISYATFQTSDTVSASAGGTFSNAVTIDADGATVLTVDRATSDGAIIDLQKDNTTVGSISSRSGLGLIINSNNSYDLTLANNGTNAYYAGNSAFYPATDNFSNLGTGGSRFKDLYLSGGVYLGGTGAANYLDDYEEGTFTPTFESTTTNPSSIVYTSRYGFYVKVGNLVNCQGLLNIDTFTSNGGNMLIGGLPFNAVSISENNDWQIGTVGYTTDFATSPSAAMIDEGSNQIHLWHYGTSDAQSNRSGRVVIGTDITSGAGGTVFFSITYRTA